MTLNRQPASKPPLWACWMALVFALLATTLLFWLVSTGRFDWGAWQW
jgi:hypothetical protein